MEIEQKLKLMKFWIFGTFIIVVTAATMYVGSLGGLGTVIFREMNYWIAIIVSGLLCGLWYFGYSKYLNRE